MDFKQILRDLQTWGYTQPLIASLVGCTQSTVSELLNGKTARPSYALGSKLEALHRKAKRNAVRRAR